MILVDGIFINNGGGKVLLDYLIEELEKTTVPIFYLLDKRLFNSNLTIKKTNKIIYLENSLIKRHLFYKKNKDLFTKVLCFGNIPPTLKLNAKVYTYFHQKLFLETTRELPLKQRFQLKIKTLIVSRILKNTDFWIVQSKAMKTAFSLKFPENQSILIIPFYPSISKSTNQNRGKDLFVYVSSGSKHKNHKNLLEAFCKFHDINKMGELHLTISNDFEELNDSIIDRIKDGYPIINHGFVSRDELGAIYGKASFSIYPSLSESFGLGIIEAIENGCSIVGSDLPYTFAVCKPSLVFDPTSIEGISNAFKLAIETEIPITEQLVFNEIDKLIELLN